MPELYLLPVRSYASRFTTAGADRAYSRRPGRPFRRGQVVVGTSTNPPGDPAGSPSGSPSVLTLRTETRRVVVDIVVTDPQGNR